MSIFFFFQNTRKHFKSRTRSRRSRPRMEMSLLSIGRGVAKKYHVNKNRYFHGFRFKCYQKPCKELDSIYLSYKISLCNSIFSFNVHWSFGFHGFRMMTSTATILAATRNIMVRIGFISSDAELTNYKCCCWSKWYGDFSVVQLKKTIPPEFLAKPKWNFIEQCSYAIWRQLIG